jgi:hypothetical protein
VLENMEQCTRPARAPSEGIATPPLSHGEGVWEDCPLAGGDAVV